MSGVTRQQGRIQSDARGVSGSGVEPIKVHTRTVTHADLTAAATSESIDISVGDDGLAIPADAMVIRASVQTLIAGAGPSITDIDVDVGDAGNPDELLDGADIDAVGYVQTPAGAYTPFTLEATPYVPLALFLLTGGNAVALTAGAWKFRIYYLAPEAPPIPA
jgi:hypothetical protein